MRAPVGIKADPTANGATGMPQRLESGSLHALLFQRADHPFDHPVLLRAVRRDELLPQPVAAYQRRVATTGEDQAIVGAQKERQRHLSLS